jgi:hypothetical protein
MSIRKDQYRIDVQENLHLLVFHKSLNIGKGVALSLYINDFEFLKFDCFGVNEGHYHLYDKIKSELIYFDEKTCEEQINKSYNELCNNIDYYLLKSNNNDIKNFTIDIYIFRDKLEIAKNKMLEYENKYYAEFR